MVPLHFFLRTFLLLSLCLLYSCDEKESPSSSTNQTIVMTVDKFTNDRSTRITIDPSNNYQAAWSSGDIVGVFPREGYQEPFTIPAEQLGQSQAIFDGGYWSLKDGLSYAAYYPFDKGYFDSPEMKTRISVSYLGQQQTGQACNVGPYDYTYSDWKTAEFGSINLKMHHIGAFIILQLPIPVTTNYTSLEISTSEPIIPIKGHYDLTSSQPVVIGDLFSSSITMKLNEFTGTADQISELYFMLPPIDLSQSNLKFTLASTEGTCIYEIQAKPINASTRYIIKPKPISSTIPGTTDEWLRKYGIITGDAGGNAPDFPIG